MATNSSEAYLASLAERSFLKLWTVPNPYRGPGKELADLIVIFGDDLIVFSDKASVFDANNVAVGWERWRRRTIEESVKQLAGAARILAASNSPIFLDSGAVQRLPYPAAERATRRLHLVAVARPHHDLSVTPPGWRSLTYAQGAAPQTPFQIGPTFATERVVHVFEAAALELLLQHLDTAPDFLDYLKSREQAVTERDGLTFSEPDLLALATRQWRQTGRFAIQLPGADTRGFTCIPKLWDEYTRSQSASRTREQNAASRMIDRLIDHFHTEFAAGRDLYRPAHGYDEHERAMRIMASENRFGRRLIADAASQILAEEDTRTFWASTVPSRDLSGVRYVWLSYPQPPEEWPLEEFERLLLRHLRQHLLVARLTFDAAVIIGVAFPNRDARALTHIMAVLNGNNWDEEAQREAKHYRALGVFANLEAFHRVHIP